MSTSNQKEISKRSRDEIVKDILEYLRAHRILTMATATLDGDPEASALEYANDGTDVYVACKPGSIKALNVSQNPRVFYELHDDIPITYESVKNLKALQVSAKVDIITSVESRYDTIFALFLERYPDFQRIPRGSRVILHFSPRKMWYLNYSKKFFLRELVEFE